MKVKALVFDAFGTLFNTANRSVEASRKICIKNNITCNAKYFYKKWKKYHRENIKNLTQFIKEDDIFIKDLYMLYKEFNVHSNHEEDVQIMLKTLFNRDCFPEVKHILNLLQSYFKIYIGSNSDNQYLESAIRKNSVVLDGYFTSETLSVYKPNKLFFIKLLSSINLNKEEIIYIGDSETDDVWGATNAGIKVIWVNRKGNLLQDTTLKPFHILKDLNGLLNILIGHSDENNNL